MVLSTSFTDYLSVLRIRDAYPDHEFEFFHPGSRIQKDSGSRIRIRIK
jgi:hypothetical protein